MNFKRSLNYTFSNSDYKYALKLYLVRFNSTSYNCDFKYVINTYILGGQGPVWLIQCHTCLRNNCLVNVSEAKS